MSKSLRSKKSCPEKMDDMTQEFCHKVIVLETELAANNRLLWLILTILVGGILNHLFKGV